MEDRSLDEFVDEGEESDSSPDSGQDLQPESVADEANGAPESDPDETDGAPESDPDLPADPEPATARWTPGGAACEACGETATRLWNDADRQVCRSCKEW